MKVEKKAFQQVSFSLLFDLCDVKELVTERTEFGMSFSALDQQPPRTPHENSIVSCCEAQLMSKYRLTELKICWLKREQIQVC